MPARPVTLALLSALAACASASPGEGARDAAREAAADAAREATAQDRLARADTRAALDAPPPEPPPEAPVAIMPALHDFGIVEVGSTSAAVTFTVRNAGSGPTGRLTVSVSEDFTVATDGCSAPLAPGGTCALGIAFAPLFAGAKSGSVTVTASPGGSASARVYGIGRVTVGLAVHPESAAFGTLLVGQRSAETGFSVRNIGDQPIEDLTVFVAPKDFAVKSDCAPRLAPLAACGGSLTFAPQSLGTKEGRLVVGGGGRSVAMTLAGRGVTEEELRRTGPFLTISPARHDFGRLVGISSSAPVTFTIRNVGAAPTAAIKLEVAGEGAASFLSGGGIPTDCGSALAPGQACSAMLSCNGEQVGSREATLTVREAAGQKASADLACTVVARRLEIAPDMFSFGKVQVGGSSAAQRFAVTNTDSLPTGVLRASMNEMGAEIRMERTLVISDDSCSDISLQPGQTCEVWIRFAPRSAGARVGYLNVGSTSSSTSARLEGTGI